ncbi:DUF2075 domain-containing protein [Mycoplasma sp. Mirounga ES2805-ORL]|uniref:DUF2075 domain-containing protein n=1 Tax=Mycoplasma sp. Mirounga ES2805-ORL TaxID=754514 RepID=UPI00197C4AFD|nr:DUF2075 domain-containing protein [Mycoplasma sp. Mirounga ES2805-ORL]QSF13751.1 DUF2075 domain-containing protein [Mycoplasma sp. Mirounga ES2805-ORL]
MDKINSPIIIHSNTENINLEIDKINNKKKKFITQYPIVYIHTSSEKKNVKVYVGETNDYFQRTDQHIKSKDIDDIFNCKNNTSFIIGHEHFNKSLTMDIETQLINYLFACDVKLLNRKRNPQNMYYPFEEKNKIFRRMWKQLNNINSTIFKPERIIRNSAIFKASPQERLTKEQKEALELILEKYNNAKNNVEQKQFILVEGTAGTGKTVLLNSVFYSIYDSMYDQIIKKHQNAKSTIEDLHNVVDESITSSINCYFVVNNKEQRKIYDDIAKKYGINKKIIFSGTEFINEMDRNNKKADLVLVDEAHLLLTQGKQSYRGKNQLNDIRDRANIVVAMFDKYQIISKEQVVEENQLDSLIQEAKDSNNYLKLDKQLRMKNINAQRWVDDFIKNEHISRIPNLDNYEIKIFESPEDLHKAIIDTTRKEVFSKTKKNIDEELSKIKNNLSRLVATYDWEFSNRTPTNSNEWEVIIGDWSLPWNKQNKSKKNKSSWVENENTLNEVGSIYTVQGFDLNYVGVILGDSVKYKDGKVVFDPSESKNVKLTSKRTTSDGTMKSYARELKKNEVNILMTRGVKGLYIYATDKQLRDALLSAAKDKNE